MRFDDPVSINAASLQVLDRDGRRVDSRRPVQPAGDPTTVTVDLPATLPAGGYAVVWQVVSADGHPIRGTSTFGVRAPPLTAAPATVPDRLTGALHTALVLVAYAGALLLVGVSYLLLTVWPEGQHAARPRRLVGLGWRLSVAAAVGLFLLQGPYGAGLGPAHLADLSLLGQTLTGRVGLLLVMRLFVLGLAVGAGPWPGTDPPSALRRNAFGLAVLFLPTFSLAGHPGEGSLAPLTVLTDAIHLAAASAWVGGLIALLWGPLAGRAEGADVVALLHRWSRAARAAVAVLVATGTTQAWVLIREPQGLRSDYGVVLLAKLTAVAVLLLLADRSRRRVANLAVVAVGAAANGAGATGVATARLRGWVLAETAIAAVVLVLTAILTGTPPPHPG
jgi:copper transport protein